MPAETKEKKLDFSDPFAPVDLQPIHVAGEKVPTRVAVRVKSDSGDYGVAGLVGANYQLMPNRRVRDVSEDIMSRTDEKLGGFENVKTLWDGKRYVDYFASRNPITSFNGSGHKQDLQVGLMVWNAYDGSRTTGFEVYALNPWCTNQYHSRNRFGFFAFRHTPGDGVDIEDGLANVTTGVQNVIRVAPLLGELRKAPLTPRMLVQAKAKVEIPQTRWGDVIDALDRYIGEGDDNAFGLYQALTDVATHKLSGMSTINVGSTITDYFLPEPQKQGGRTAVVNHTTAQAVVADREREGVFE